MIRNYLTIAVRNLLKRKVYSFINIGGLAIGVAVCLVILKYVDFELSYDTFHQNAANIYRVTTVNYQNGELRGTNAVSGYALGPSLLTDIPEVKNYVRTHPMYGGAVISNNPATGEPLRFTEENIQYADSTFFDVFSYEFIEGNRATAFNKPTAMVITETTKKKYFGDATNVIGKTLQISGGWTEGSYEVTGVIKDVPQNSHFQFDFIVNIHSLLQNPQYKNDNGWGWNNFVTYVELYPKANLQNAINKLPAFVEKYQGKELAKSNSKAEIALQPIRAIHINPGNQNEPSQTISINTIYFFIVVAIFILAIAWINYINLSTARALERAKEVGVKKSMGVYRSQLILQFMFESIVVNFLSVALSVLIAMALLPALGQIMGKTFQFDFTSLPFWLVIVGLFLIGSFVSGAYPAFVLSSFNPVRVLKGSVDIAGNKFSMRKALVIFQFAASLILIAGTFAIYRQVSFMRTQDKGLTMDQMLIFNGPRVVEREGVIDRLISFKNELKTIVSVENVATSGAIPGGGFNWGTGIRKNNTPEEDNRNGSVVWVDPDFIKTYNIDVVKGKTWNAESESDMKSILINEAAITSFGLGTAEKALDEKIILGNDTLAILGVLRNYHWNSLKSEHTPFILAPGKIHGRKFSVHLSGKTMHESIEKIEKLYKERFPGNPFTYYFLDDFYNQQYRDDQQFGKIFSMFAGLAIIIACLGLWGLASFTTAQKLKEIGVRKVLGASIPSILRLLTSQFMTLVMIACVIALPVTWYALDKWLSTFAFRIGLGWDLFVVPVVILVIIALTTISIQIARGAATNPAKILRSE